MSWIGMFPGQGSQEPGMGKELLEKYPELLIDIFDIIFYYLYNLFLKFFLIHSLFPLYLNNIYILLLKYFYLLKYIINYYKIYRILAFIISL